MRCCMIYKHSETGAVVTTDSALSGAWKPVKKDSKSKKEEKEATE